MPATSTSPSVYMVFDYVTANNICGGVGNRLDSVTVAASPSEISTWGFKGQVSASQFDFKDLNQCPKTVPQRLISGTLVDTIPLTNDGYDKCQPDVVFK